MKRWCLLQLSDPHLSPDPFFGVNTLHSFEACLEAYLPEADMVLVTGDLVQSGGAPMYHWLNQKLAAHDTPYALMCGNHDSEVSALFEAEAESELDSAQRRPAQCQALPAELISHRVLMLGAWKLILLNSSKAGTPSGHLDAAALDFLAGELDSADGPVVVALHHQPCNVGAPLMDSMGLKEPKGFWKLIGSSQQVKAVIHGHTHQDAVRSHLGVQVLGCPATSVQFEPGATKFSLSLEQPGCRLIWLFDDGRLESQVKRLNNVRFIPDRDASGYGS